MAAKKTKAKKAKTSRKVGKKTAAKTGKSGANALDFCRAYLQKKPDAAYAEIRDAAEKKGLKLYPISFGRAQALEGIVKAKPYGSRKKAAGKRGPGRPKGSKNKPRTASASTATAGLEGLVSTLRGLERERDEAVALLEKIRQLVG